MTEHREFGTFIIASAEQAGDIDGFLPSEDWSLTTRDDPSQRHWSDELGRTSTTLYGPVGPDRLRHLQDRIPSKQIIIRTLEAETASNVNSLVYGGILLGSPNLIDHPQPPEVYPLDEIAEEAVLSEPFSKLFHDYSTAAFGCKVAKRAWGDLSFIYAVEKYKSSLQLDWFTPHSAAPHYGQKFSNEYPDYAYHVDAAFAIVAGFSVVEELGLEVRSSSKRPRFVGTEKDEWNPLVRQDLESRLAERGVDFEEPYYWVLRGQPTNIEIEMKPKLGEAAPYARDNVVRDRKMTLVDAIHQTSWLRNYITAHKFSELNRFISPYDVFNVQNVARRLLLGCLGLW